MESSTRKKNTMIIAGMVILTILAFLLINFFSGTSDNPGNNAGPSKQALIEEIEELESSIVELEVVFQTIQFEEDMSKELLEEKRDEIRNFDQKVKEQRKKIDDLQAKLDAAKQRGDVDKETIAKLQASIDKAREKQTVIQNDFTQQEIEFLYMENRKLTAYNDSLERERMKPDSLMLLLGDLKAQLRDCGNGNSPALTQRGTEIDETMVKEAITELTANKQKAELVLYNRVNKVDEQLTSSERARKMQTVIAKYQITDNNIEKFLNGSEMYLVVKGLDGQEITSNNNRPSIKKCGNGTCVVAGEGLFKSGEGITFQFEPKDGEWIKDEAYIFSIFIDGTEVRRKNLLIK
ncbi:MAG: hypothetical protein AB8H47_16810 [Bacteroidia bacterium]